MKLPIVLSCEHATNRVPDEYADCFVDARAALASHEGWDAGAIELAIDLARHFKTAVIAAPMSRLVIETNRSLSNPRVFSRFTTRLDAERKQVLIDTVYQPHHDAIIAAVVRAGRQASVTVPVLHLALHSFTPVWEGVVREVDLGILYDPDRKGEAALAKRFKAHLAAIRPDLRVHSNQPYLGISDGLTTELRKRFAPDQYLGIEIEVNQAITLGPPFEWQQLRQQLVATFDQICAHSSTETAP